MLCLGKALLEIFHDPAGDLLIPDLPTLYATGSLSSFLEPTVFLKLLVFPQKVLFVRSLAFCFAARKVGVEVSNDLPRPLSWIQN